jgi:hypothetical protein
MKQRSSRGNPDHPAWPEWVAEEFTPDGQAWLDEVYAYLKTQSGLERAARISANDMATSAVAVLHFTDPTKLQRH